MKAGVPIHFLYFLNNELNNLIECPEYGDIVCELENKLDGWVKDVITRTGDKEEAAKLSPALK